MGKFLLGLILFFGVLSIEFSVTARTQIFSAVRNLEKEASETFSEMAGTYKNVYTFAGDSFKSISKRGAYGSVGKIAQSDNEVKGAVVAPSEDADANERIQKQFSDGVEIIKSDDGVSGVIRPIFDEPTDDTYFYVLVPIEE